VARWLALIYVAMAQALAWGMVLPGNWGLPPAFASGAALGFAFHYGREAGNGTQATDS
jgi:hypothetical protein